MLVRIGMRLSRDLGENMIVIGIIGGIGTGKTEIVSFLKSEYNAYTILGDDVGHHILMKGQAAYKPVVEYFGTKILDDEGEIDRKKLGQIVFSDEKELQVLNRITHPIMYEIIRNDINEKRRLGTYKWIAFEAAVMIEAGFYDFVDTMWYINCDLEKRKERLIAFRNYSPQRIEQILKNQSSDDIMRSYGDVTIDNSGTFEQTKMQIRRQMDILSEENHEK